MSQDPTPLPSETPTAEDIAFLRRAIEISEMSRASGNHPFGAVLVGPDGDLLMEQENGFEPHCDGTAHAERLLMTRASIAYESAFLSQCTIYSSAEPCAMCSGAIYWAGIGRLVYGLSEAALGAHIGPHPDNLTMNLPCRTVLDAGQREIQVIGPLIEAEALEVHKGFWTD